MPKIERSVAYTFDAYSGGPLEDMSQGKSPKSNSNQQVNRIIRHKSLRCLLDKNVSSIEHNRNGLLSQIYCCNVEEKSARFFLMSPSR